MFFNSFLLFVLSYSNTVTPGNITSEKAPISVEEQAAVVYLNLTALNTNLPDMLLFQKAYKGFYELKSQGLVKKDVLTVIDFRLSSKKKRLWVIDLQQLKVLHYTLVAHGKNTGDEFASYFSNRPESNQSSLGFYLTGDTYIGKHGLSLYLDGVEKGINDKARSRSIVMHGADYVSKSFIDRYGRLGRSFGCPSVPMELHEDIINEIKEKSCLFIYYPDNNYVSHSSLLNEPIISRKDQHR